LAVKMSKMTLTGKTQSWTISFEAGSLY